MSWVMYYIVEFLMTMPLAMLCFHLTVKKRASPPMRISRIQNVLCHVELVYRSCWGGPYATTITVTTFYVVAKGVFLAVFWIFECFNMTLGYPGEGPKWSAISANIDSFAASNGTFRIPSSGTATCAHREFTQLFDDRSDMSGTWQILRPSARITATWHQVSASVKLLAFNFYAIANAAAERAKFERNNELLNQIFTVAAQYGDVPILLAGDFQMEPGMYPSVQLALDHWGWSDPPLQTNEHGEAFRPCTFFQQAASEEGEGQSSIDGILLNQSALTALMIIEVLDHQDRQRRPIKATFMWDRVQQTGTVLQRYAKLNLDDVTRATPSEPDCPVNALGEQIWQSCESDFASEQDVNRKWDLFNDCAVKLLILNGATWEKGPRVRGKLPKFWKIKMSAPQDAAGHYAPPRLLLLQACLRSLHELEFRFGRDTNNGGDSRTFWHTQRKLLRRMKEANLIPLQRHHLFVHDIPHLVEVTLRAIAAEIKQQKFLAIRKWKEAMRLATTSMTIGKVVYQYLMRMARLSLIHKLPWMS